MISLLGGRDRYSKKNATGCTVKQHNTLYKRGFLLLHTGEGSPLAPLLCVNQDFIKVKL